MKLNNIDFDKLTDNELKQLCLKYKLIDPQKINFYQKNPFYNKIIKWFVLTKLKNYGHRRHSINGNLQKTALQYQKNSGHPKPEYNTRERDYLNQSHKMKFKMQIMFIIKIKSQAQAQQINQQNLMNKKYDEIGMYPAQKRLVAIGDLHGDLIATLKVLKLAELFHNLQEQMISIIFIGVVVVLGSFN